MKIVSTDGITWTFGTEGSYVKTLHNNTLVKIGNEICVLVGEGRAQSLLNYRLKNNLVFGCTVFQLYDPPKMIGYADRQYLIRLAGRWFQDVNCTKEWRGGVPALCRPYIRGPSCRNLCWEDGHSILTYRGWVHPIFRTTDLATVRIGSARWEVDTWFVPPLKGLVEADGAIVDIDDLGACSESMYLLEKT